MKSACLIFFLVLGLMITQLKSIASDRPSVQIDFYGEIISFQPDSSFLRKLSLPVNSIQIVDFINEINKSGYTKCTEAILQYKDRFKPDDWLFYQLVRKTAQQISPKSENYIRYTLYKYFLMLKSGYDVMLSMSGEKLLFYIHSDENIYNIPSRVKNGKQYICLNFHDYKNLDINKERFEEINFEGEGSKRGFSYKITSLPDFPKDGYVEKEINFNYYQLDYHLKVKINPDVKSIFANYPVVDYSDYFNIPLSKETYESLIPVLKKQVKGMNTKNGVDYLMRFTRYAFSFETDIENFGDEKRLSPEQTLLYEKSDCDDRAALLFYLVKEIYDLPMIVLSYPKHVTIAIQFDKPIGKPIVYNGQRYSVCEPTPQNVDLPMGHTLYELRNVPFEVVYAYSPTGR